MSLHRDGRLVQELERRFQPDGSAASAAREFAAAAMPTHPDLVDTVALLVSELASNAILYARTTFLVRVNTRRDRIRIEVADGSPVLPGRKFYATDAVTGRGIAIVESLADRWGAAPTPDGKIVWFEIDLPERDHRG